MILFIGVLSCRYQANQNKILSKMKKHAIFSVGSGKWLYLFKVFLYSTPLSKIEKDPFSQSISAIAP
ncbi:hypothetical protein BACI71_70726 [Bacillus mycoides]|uniref:Uncharacterized protein n=1 Tax=Bacillus mycoides TaxID=1405 RepID=A0A654BUM8_BACMY|nr:hypothetical protein BACI71_70726 [Bacillus mycoides]